jgi:hypothetical protein
MHLSGKREAHDAGVVDDDDDDRESAEKIETRLALAVREARVDGFVCRLPVDTRTVANGFRK